MEVPQAVWRQALVMLSWYRWLFLSVFVSDMELSGHLARRGLILSLYLVVSLWDMMEMECMSGIAADDLIPSVSPRGCCHIDWKVCKDFPLYSGSPHLVQSCWRKLESMKMWQSMSDLA